MSRRPVRRTAAGPPRDWTGEWLGVGCGVLWTARFLIPAETADEGETLWIVMGWLLLAALAAWISQREGRFQLRLGRADFAVAALAGTQVLAGLAVWWLGGDRRSALNMIWEWIGVAAAFVLLRQWGAQAAHRRRLLGLSLTVGVVLSGLGLWQRFVWYPQVQADYREWEALTAGQQGHSAATQRRIEALTRALGPDLLALDGPSRAALRQRVLDSQEPFGRFGLTNTFAGVLAVVLVWLSGCRPAAGWRPLLLWAALLGLVGLALLLTRSRTAWLAALCGVGFVIGSRWLARRSATPLVAPRIWAAVRWGMVALPLLAVLLVLLGAVDRQDWQEAPKSVLYRLQYWTATGGVIREHPLLGVGPGNFRQHYLRYKLPEASEEISDPHNLYFDVWATGGAASLAALLWLTALAAGVWKSRRTAAAAAGENRDAAAIGDRGHWRWTSLVVAVSCGLCFLVSDLFARRTEWQLAWLAVSALPAAWLTERLLAGVRDWRAVETAAAAAGLALTVHLLTSGGIAMPVIILLWLVTTFLLTGGERICAVASTGAIPPAADATLNDPLNSGRVLSDRYAAATALGATALLAAGLWTAWGPVTLSRLYRQAGNAALTLDRRPDRAVALLQSAADADPLDPEPWRDLSLAELSLSRAAGPEAGRHFEAAISAAQAAIARDPVNPYCYRALGQMWMSRAADESLPEASGNAVAAYELAIARYPNSSRLTGEYALALRAAGQSEAAREAAARALQLDDINRRAGHYDKTFTAGELEQWQRLAAPSSPPAPADAL